MDSLYIKGKWSQYTTVRFEISSFVFKIQIGKMQLFLELRKYFKILGIEPNKKHLFSTENVIELILFVYCFGAMVTFLLFEPNKTFFDLGNTFYGAVCMALNIVTLLSNVIKQAKIFGLIKNIEEIIKNSKL